MTNPKLNEELEKSKVQIQQDTDAAPSQDELSSDDLEDVSGGLIAEDDCSVMGNCGIK